MKEAEEVQCTNTLDRIIQPKVLTMHNSDLNMMATNKTKGGSMFFFINSSWCTIVETASCFFPPDLRFLAIRCWPFLLLREFSVVLLTAFYILL